MKQNLLGKCFGGYTGDYMYLIIYTFCAKILMICGFGNRRRGRRR